MLEGRIEWSAESWHTVAYIRKPARGFLRIPLSSIASRRCIRYNDARAIKFEDVSDKDVVLSGLNPAALEF